MSDHGMPSRFASEPALPDDLSARIRAAVAATPAARTSTRLRVGLAMAVVPVVTAAVLFASHVALERSALRIDLGTLAISQLAIALLPVVALALAATIVAVGRGEHGLGPTPTTLALVALLVAPIYAAFAFAGPLVTSVAAVATLIEPSRWGIRCLAIATIVGALALTTFAAALRRSAPAASRLRGAAVGAAAGAWAGLSVFVFCPAVEPRHLLFGHVLPIVVLTLLGLAAIPRVLRPG